MTKKWTTIFLSIMMTAILTACNNDSVKYKLRKYLGPPDVYNMKELREKFGDDMVDTGEKVEGLRVVDTTTAIEAVKKYHTVPTLLILKKNQNEYLVYSLSGGP